MTPELGTWMRITRGPHRNKTGVIDLISEFPLGTFFRVTNPHDKLCHGRFPADQLEPIEAPSYESKIDAQTMQTMMDLLVKRSA